MMISQRAGTMQIHGFRFDDFQRLAEKCAGDFHFRADAGLLADRGHIQGRMMADGERDFHRFVVIFVFRAHIVGVIGGIDHQAELSLALLLMAVDADVDRAGAALFADQRRGVDIGAGVAFVEGEDRQQIEIGVVAFQNHFFARRVFGGDFFHRHGMMLPVRQVFDHLRHRGRAQR